MQNAHPFFQRALGLASFNIMEKTVKLQWFKAECSAMRRWKRDAETEHNQEIAAFCVYFAG